jgi:hypothetical protein
VGLSKYNCHSIVIYWVDNDDMFRPSLAIFSKENVYIFMNETCLKAVGIHCTERDLVVDRFLIYVIGSVCIQDKIRNQIKIG